MSLYRRIGEEVARRADALWSVASALHADPETAFAEHRAAALLSGELEGAGFEVRRGVAGLPTAFTARAGRGRPVVAFPLEYDALPGLGHACGHNLIAAAGLGAALVLDAVREGAEGTVLAVGTPAEEGGGGKALEVEAGVFDGVDAALMFHPGVYDWMRAPLTAQEQYRVSFRGRAAHPTGNPTEGIDALAALIELFNVLSALGRRLPEGSHVQGIITQGGTATNIVPEYAEGRFGLRALTTAALDELAGQLSTAAEGWPWRPARWCRWSGRACAMSTSGTARRCPSGSPGIWTGPGSPSPRPRPASIWAPPTSATSAAGCRPSIPSSRSRAPGARTTRRSSPRPRPRSGRGRCSSPWWRRWPARRRTSWATRACAAGPGRGCARPGVEAWRSPRAVSYGVYGKDVTLEGTVSVPEVGAPVLLTTWAYWPLPPREITIRSCILMPEVTGTWKPWVCTIDGSVVKLQ